MQNHLDLIRNVRGSMTRFDPLTPEIVAAQSQDGLTYQELKAAMADYGMDIEKVVYDGSRSFQNAFFADFEHGHYCWIPFQKSDIKDEFECSDFAFSKLTAWSNLDDDCNCDWQIVPIPPVIT